MTKDIIVEEVRRSREKIAARNNYSIDRIFAEAKINQQKHIKAKKVRAA